MSAIEATAISVSTGLSTIIIANMPETVRADEKSCTKL